MKLSEKASNVKGSTTLNLSALANKLKADGVNVINFASGEPDFDTPEYIKNAAIEAINSNYTKYTPYEGSLQLREAIAEKLKRENNLNYYSSQIVVSNGSKHAINNALISILEQGDEVILPAPYWLSYAEIIKMAGGIAVEVRTEMKDGFKVNVEMLEQVLTDKTKALIINSPNNPTGMMYSEEELKKIADFVVKNDLFVISDELYEKLIYSNKMPHVSIASLNPEIFDRTIVVNGFSKSYAMTGWRVGYTASNKQIAEVIASVQSHSTSNVNSIAQMAALAALQGNDDDINEMIREFKYRRDYTIERITHIPFLSCLIPKGAFYLFIDISKLCGMECNGEIIKDSVDISDILFKKYNVVVVPCNKFGYDNYIRLSFATSMMDIVEGINRIEMFIKTNFG